VGGWLFECLEERVESGRGEHVDLVDDEDLVLADLGRDAYLVDEVADVIDGVVGGGIQLVDVQRTLFVESLAGLTFVAGLAVGLRVEAVNGFGENAGTGGLADTTGSTE